MSAGEMMDFAKLAILGLAILIPITGFTARFALRPIADALVRLRSAGEPQMEQRVRRIEAEMEALSELRASVERLTDELEFQRKLALPAGDAMSSSTRQNA